MHLTLPRLTRALAAVAGVVAVASCGDKTGTDGTVKDYFSAVQAVVTTAAAPAAPSAAFRPSVGAKTKASRPLFSALPTQTVNGQYHNGTPPTGSGGPSITDASEGSTPLLGQPFRYAVEGSAEFSKLYLWVDGVDGYFELDLPVSVTSLQLVLQITENAGSSFELEASLSGNGGVGAAHSSAIQTVDLSNADIVATVKWTGASDVDLHVIDPNGFEVFYNADHSPEGGSLDLDSNAGCSIDNVNQETISWLHGTAPSGHYKVIVDYFDDCGVTSSPFTGTVSKNGSQVKSFTGNFAGLSSDNTPITVYEFDY